MILANKTNMQQIKHLQVQWSKDYTPLRRFYAWVGSVTLILAAVALVYAVIWANAYVDASLAL